MTKAALRNLFMQIKTLLEYFTLLGPKSF